MAWEMSSPVVLVLDDVHLLDNQECRAALSVLADHVPGGSRLVLAGRTQPPLRIARLRAESRILEIGPTDLSLTLEEAASLLREAGAALSRDETAELYRRTEGWPAGLYLAALYLREGGSLPGAAVSFGGDDQLVSEYVESEFLARISRRQREFLTRTAVLERMCGPLCEAVLHLPGSSGALADLARSNLLLVPLDRRGEWYRYHHLFRDMLLAQLHRFEPELIPVLQLRAAGWCLENGLPEAALEYSMAAGDAETAGGLMKRLAVHAYRQGRVTTLRRWFGWLEGQGDLMAHPMAAVVAGLVTALTGRPVEAERWADAVDRWQYGDPARPGDPLAEGWAALLRALLCRRGAEQMRADADEAVRKSATDNLLRPPMVLYQGVARVLCGEAADAEACFQDAIGLAEEAGAPEAVAEALAERSLLAMADDQWGLAESLADQAHAVMRRAGIEESVVAPLICGVRAHTAAHRGDALTARQQLAVGQRMRPVLTYAVPHEAVQARIELARVCRLLGDTAGARTLLREIDEVLRRRPRPGHSGRPGPGAAAADFQSARFSSSRSLGPDRRRAASVAAAVHAPVAPRDRPRAVPVPQHHQDPGDLDLPQAGCRLTPAGGRPGPEPWAARRVMASRPGSGLARPVPFTPIVRCHRRPTGGS
jgi:LuxR family transcriptional regulator, maltose regulon positive regulatory protein